ncbi:LysR substrate-binding domain-containing protein, partial [Xanthobacteraceae bacterium Astr-EGSB]|uniref:LysR substrate-binding domain-containing protein n=1 Tax=Astrobacterium formosum TaxID=3069710 RepID=UPI0027B3EB56|nr:LysR substrate-binding domain-containing protein [Xanthobacteraceae bacterium Astr-EGSB]
SRDLPMPPHFRRRDIVEETLVCVGSPNLLSGRTITRRNAGHVPFIVMASRPDIFPRWLSETRWPTPATISSVQRTYMAIRAAIAGLGALVVPEVLIVEEIRSGLLVPVSPVTMASGWRYALFFDPDRARYNPAMTIFGEWIGGEIGQEGSVPSSPSPTRPDEDGGR